METKKDIQYADDYKFLIDQLIKPGFSTKFYDDEIEYHKNKISKLESSNLTDKTEIRTEKIRLSRAIAEKEKAVQRLVKIKRLIQDYKSVASYSARLDGNPVASTGMFSSYETVYGVKRSVYSYQDIENQIDVALNLLGYKMIKISDSEKSSIRELHQLQIKIQDLLENSYGRNSIIFKNDNKSDINAPNSLYDLSQLPNLFDNILYFSNHRESKFVPEVIDTGDLQIDTRLFSSRREKYCYEEYPRIKKIEEMLKYTTEEDRMLGKALELYKEYVKTYVACQVIKELLPSLNPYGLNKYEKVVYDLSKIVAKELQKCQILKREADKLYQPAKEKLLKNPYLAEKFFEKSGEELEQIKEEYVEDKKEQREQNIANEQKISSREEMENLGKETKKEETLTELEIKNLSSGYRSRYIQEKIKKSALGQLDYLDFLKQEYPEQVQLIDYITEQEKETRTIYAEYLRDRTKRIANDQKVIKFKDYVERIKGKEYYDLEIPLDIEEELKRERMI